MITNKFRDCERNLKMFRDIYFEDQINEKEKGLESTVSYKTISLLIILFLIMLIFTDSKEWKWIFLFVFIFIIYWKNERDMIKRDLELLKEGRKSLIDIEKSVKLLRRTE